MQIASRNLPGSSIQCEVLGLHFEFFVRTFNLNFQGNITMRIIENVFQEVVR